MKAIIIEDETAAARNLRKVLDEVSPEIEILATLESVRKSVSWLTTNRHPDIIFMDIHLSDGDSFHIFDMVDVKSHIIFTTAYDEYAIKAFKVRAIDYLLKPIVEEEVVRAIGKFKSLRTPASKDYLGLFPLSAEENQSQRTLLSFYQNRIIPIDPRRVAYFQSEKEKVSAFMLNGDVFPMEKPLNSLMTMVDSGQFFRANRQFLISRKLIKEVLIWEGSRLAIISHIDVPDQIIISKERAADFKNWLQGNL